MRELNNKTVGYITKKSFPCFVVKFFWQEGVGSFRLYGIPFCFESEELYLRQKRELAA